MNQYKTLRHEIKSEQDKTLVVSTHKIFVELTEEEYRKQIDKVNDEVNWLKKLKQQSDNLKQEVFTK